MKKIISYIYEEDDYSVFKSLDKNRDVLKNRLDKLIASISEKYLLNPIMVNEYMQIIDGQGRYEALKILSKPIHYYVVPGADGDDCIRMNKYNTKWISLDYAKSYAKAGNPNYQRLLKACQYVGVTIKRALRLSNHGTTDNKDNRNGMSIFERGLLAFSDEDAEKVKDICEKADQIAKALLTTNRLNEAFYTAVKVMCEFDGYDHERMLKNCTLNRATYAQMSNLGNQLKEFERIYNYKSKKNKLFFSDYMRNKGYSVRNYDNSTSPFKEMYSGENVSTLEKEEEA